MNPPNKNKDWEKEFNKFVEDYGTEEAQDFTPLERQRMFDRIVETLISLTEARKDKEFVEELKKFIFPIPKLEMGEEEEKGDAVADAEIKGMDFAIKQFQKTIKNLIQKYTPREDK